MYLQWSHHLKEVYAVIISTVLFKFSFLLIRICLYLQALVRTLSGVVNKISNIIPNSSDIPSSMLPNWTDEDSLDINFAVGTSLV